MLFTVFRVAYPFLVVLSDSQLAKKIGSIIRYVAETIKTALTKNISFDILRSSDDYLD